jgi:hypothetical protein
MDGYYQPKIFDTRDLLYEALGTKYTYKLRLINIV